MMNLYAVATYAERGTDKNFWLGIYFVFANDEDQARAAGIEHCRLVDSSFDFFYAEVTVAPVDTEMLPRIAEILKARKFLEGVTL
jgi:hypothetical protein